MTAGLDGFRPKPSLEKGAAMRVHFVVSFRIAIKYKLWQIPSRFIPILPDEKMIMIWHQTIGKDANLPGMTVFFYLRYCVKVIGLFAENGYLPSTSIVDMIIDSFLPNEGVFAGVGHIETYR